MNFGYALRELMIPKILGVYESEPPGGEGGAAGGRGGLLQLAAHLPCGEVGCLTLGEELLPATGMARVGQHAFLFEFHWASNVYEDRLRGTANSLRDKVNALSGLQELATVVGREGALLDALLTFLDVDRAQASEDVLFPLRGMLDAMRQTGDVVFEYQLMLTSAAIEMRKAKRFDAALSLYRKALALDGDKDRIMFNMARVCHEMGNVDEARALLAEALESTPDFAEARRFLRYLDAAGN